MTYTQKNTAALAQVQQGEAWGSTQGVLPIASSNVPWSPAAKDSWKITAQVF